MLFKKIFNNFEMWQKILLSYKVPQNYIFEQDYNFIVDLIADTPLFSNNLRQIYAICSLEWQQQYGIYLQQEDFYSKKVGELNEQINSNINGLFDLASNENNTINFNIKNFNSDDLAKYLSGFSSTSADQAKAYIDNFQNFNNYLQTLRANNPKINLYKNFITQITLPLEIHDNSAYAEFWKIENAKLKNNTKLGLDNDNQTISNVAAALTDDQAVNLTQLKNEVGKIGLWKQETQSGKTYLLPKTASDISAENRFIYNLQDPQSDQDAATKKYVDTNINSVNTKVKNNTNTINQEKQTLASVQATANNALAEANTNKTNIKTAQTELTDLEKRTTNSFFSKVDDAGVFQVENIKSTADNLNWNYNQTNKTITLINPTPPTKNGGIDTKIQNYYKISDIKNIRFDLTKFSLTYLSGGIDELNIATRTPYWNKIDLMKNTDGFLRELNNKMDLKNKNYNIRYILAAKERQFIDQIVIWPNSDIVHWECDFSTINDRGGVIGIWPLNGIIRFAAPSIANPTKRLLFLSLRFYNNWQWFVTASDGTIYWSANLMKDSKLNITKHEFWYQEV